MSTPTTSKNVEDTDAARLCVIVNAVLPRLKDGRTGVVQLGAYDFPVLDGVPSKDIAALVDEVTKQGYHAAVIQLNPWKKILVITTSEWTLWFAKWQNWKTGVVAAVAFAGLTLALI